MKWLLFTLTCLVHFSWAGRSSVRRQQWRLLRPSCGSLEGIMNYFPRYTSFPLAPRPRDFFPFPFFAKKGFRGFGIPSDLLDDRMGTPCEGPVVEPLTYGSFDLNNDTLKVKATVTLVTDERKETGEICLILVDSGMTSQRMELLSGLSAVGVRPEYINNVVLTHLDLDTVGNLNLFPTANVYVGNRRAKGDTVFFPKSVPSFDQTVSDLPFSQLCDNTFVYLTPGFTNEDVSLVVKNVSGFGTITVTGNLIIDSDDIESNDSVNRFVQNSEHRQLWETSRKEVICMSDYIVPGYGKVVNMTETNKATYKCNS